VIDRSQFYLLTAALAAGGTATACDLETLMGRPLGGAAPAPAAAPASSAPPAATSAAPAGPIEVTIVEQSLSPAATPCDDSLGTPEACPNTDPSDEGICPNLIGRRCNEFKATMKPRVATHAVACLRALKGTERCDPARINRCGHAALMSACPEPARPKKGTYHAATAAQPATVTVAPEPSGESSPVGEACKTIVKSCGDAPLAPTMADCRQTLAGMNELGRAFMIDCVSNHCLDRGLYGCEAVPKVVGAGR